MAGRCCCCLDDHKSTITVFAAINIVVYAVCLLACSKEYSIVYPALKDWQTFQNSSDWRDNEVYTYRIKNYASALVAAIVISVLGIAASLVLLCDPKRKNGYIIFAWIIFECIAFITMLILGGFIVHIKNLNGPISWKYTLPNIPYSSLFLLCACPVLLWSAISTGASLQGMSYDEEGVNMISPHQDNSLRQHFRIRTPGSASTLSPNFSSVIQYPDTPI